MRPLLRLSRPNSRTGCGWCRVRLFAKHRELFGGEGESVRNEIFKSLSSGIAKPCKGYSTAFVGLGLDSANQVSKRRCLPGNFLLVVDTRNRDVLQKRLAMDVVPPLVCLAACHDDPIDYRM